MLNNVYGNEARFLVHLQAHAANINQYKNEIAADAVAAAVMVVVDANHAGNYRASRSGRGCLKSH